MIMVWNRSTGDHGVFSLVQRHFPFPDNPFLQNKELVIFYQLTYINYQLVSITRKQIYKTNYMYKIYRKGVLKMKNRHMGTMLLEINH